jgi:23S rRNA-intervening sequence protein
MQGFRNLKVWEKAHAVTLDIYSASRRFPKEELYGLTSQMRRASASMRRQYCGGRLPKGRCGVWAVSTYCDWIGQ